MAPPPDIIVGTGTPNHQNIARLAVSIQNSSIPSGMNGVETAAPVATAGGARGRSHALPSSGNGQAARQARRRGGSRGVERGEPRNAEHHGPSTSVLQLKRASADGNRFGNGRLLRKLLGPCRYDLSYVGLRHRGDHGLSRRIIQRGNWSHGARRLPAVDPRSDPYSDGRFDKVFAVNVIYFWGPVAARVGDAPSAANSGGAWRDRLR